MLVSMIVRNIALIEHLEISFHAGMHVLSGETGAGKSILVDSINLVLGERADRGLIRSGCDHASVEALMDVSRCPSVLELLSQQQLEAEGGLMSIRREISTEGRNLCRVCGVIVPLAFLKQVTERLVDVHGQHDHQSLLNEKNHLAFLDAFGDADFAALKDEVAKAYGQWRRCSAAYAALRRENAKRAERQAYLETRVRDLDEASISTGEADRLSAEATRYAGAEKIDRAVRAAYGLVSGSEESALDKLRLAGEDMRRICAYDERFAALADRLDGAFYEVEELGRALRDILEAQNYDAERDEAVRERLDLIRRLERRYGAPADELAALHERLRAELEHLDGLDSALKRAEAEYRQKLRVYRDAAARLTQQRTELARSLESAMERELADLGMASTRFQCVFQTPAPEKRAVPTAEGDDQVCFYISPNPGEPLKPLDRTASGGELSRLMLAMKAVGAEHGGIPTMIFDEIDTGISGHIAAVVARKMAAIARYHQVLCVTHLAQIAAMADTQYVVKKQVVGERTFTTAQELDPEGRVEEVARLIGVTDSRQQSGLDHARNLLVESRRWKTQAEA